MSDEVRVTSSTGGEKGSKPAQLAFAPADAMLELAKVYGFGATKYAPHNFRKGYELSLTLNALYRHVLAFQGGEDVDPESGLSHMAHAAWHCLNAIQTLKDHPEFDDRYSGAEAPPLQPSLREALAKVQQTGGYIGRADPSTTVTFNDAPDIEGRDVSRQTPPFGPAQCSECGRYNWHKPDCTKPTIWGRQVLPEHRRG